MTATTKEAMDAVVACITELDPNLEVKWSEATGCWYVASRVIIKGPIPNSFTTVCPHRRGFYEVLLEFFGRLIDIPTTSWVEIAGKGYRWDGVRFKEL